MDFVKPYDTMIAITPDDATDNIDSNSEAIICTGAGDVVMSLSDGAAGTVDITFTMALNEILKFKPSRIKATGTTATVYSIY